MEQGSEQLPQKERINLPKQQWRSSYNAVALQTLERVDNKAKVTLNETSARKEKLGRYLDAIDTEIADNFAVFESKQYPGVKFPHSSISVRKVGDIAQNRPVELQEEVPKKITYVVFTPFSPPPGGDPDDVMNAVYDRVFSVLPEINSPDKNITVHVLGLPTNKWGSVSEEWVRDLKKGVVETEEGVHGFSQHGKLYAEFLHTIFPQNQTDLQNMHIRFYGSSMGSILASETAKQLPEIWDNLRVLVDVPTGTHKPTGKTIKLPFVGTLPLSGKGLQILGGFGAELQLRMWFDDLVKTSFGGKKRAREELTSVLLEQGIVPHESKAEDELKKDAFKQEIKLLIRGTPFDTEDFRSYVVQGMLDPATITPKRVLSLMIGKKLFKAGRSLGMGINYTHWMDRGRWIYKWIRKVEQYERLK